MGRESIPWAHYLKHRASRRVDGGPNNDNVQGGNLVGKNGESS